MNLRMVNYDTFGMYKNTATNRMPVKKEKVAGKATMTLVGPSGRVHILPMNNSNERAIARRVKNFLFPIVKKVEEKVDVKPAKPTKWSYTFIRKIMRGADGGYHQRVCKVTGSNGVVKYFGTKKAAQTWVKLNTTI